MTRASFTARPTWRAVALAGVAGILAGVGLVLVLQGGRACDTERTELTYVETCTRTVTP